MSHMCLAGAALYLIPSTSSKLHRLLLDHRTLKKPQTKKTQMHICYFITDLAGGYGRANIFLPKCKTRGTISLEMI